MSIMNPTHSRRSIGFRLVRLSFCVIVCTEVLVATAYATDDGAARPIAVWPAGPLQVFASFDRPVLRTSAEALVGLSIPYFPGSASALGLKSNSQPLGRLAIAGVRLIDDNRTIVIATDPHPRSARYVLPLPSSPQSPRSGTRVNPTVAYDLSGVEVTWSDEVAPDAPPRWSGWWPSLDSAIARELTRGSRPHGEVFELLRKRGRLVISTLVRLPKGSVSFQLVCNQPIDEALLGDAQGNASDDAQAKNHRLSITCTSPGEPLYLTTTVRTGEINEPLLLRGTYRIGDEKTDHPVERNQQLLPWAPLANGSTTQSPVLVPDLAGGDPARGKVLFTGPHARCAQCHVFRGQGEKVGPDLTDIERKGRAEIYRSIAAPSADIEPAYSAYTVITKNGQVVAGMVRAEGALMIRVTDTNAHTTLISRSQVDQIRPSASSIMPVGLTATMGASAIRDIIAFLTSPDPRAASR
jgi:putative heme-binding domain-containing protein